MNEFITLAEFRGLFPEFVSLSDASVQFWLDLCEQYINPCIFKNQTKLGHAYITADNIAASPFGRELKLNTTDGTTDYTHAYNRIVDLVSPGMSVLGSSAPFRGIRRGTFWG